MFFALLVAAGGVGLLTALTGAWKDTLWEPFEWKKFLRSPVITAVCGYLLLMVTDAQPTRSYIILFLLSSIGLERLVTEAWKAVLRKMPSKFNRSERDTGWLRERLQKLNRGK